MKTVLFYTCSLLCFFQLTAMDKTDPVKTTAVLNQKKLEDCHYMGSVCLAYQNEGTITTIREAILRQKLTLLKKMLEGPRADINSQDELGWTPLILAIYMDAQDIISVLLDHPETDPSLQDKSNKNAYDWALNKNAEDALMHRILAKLQKKSA